MPTDSVLSAMHNDTCWELSNRITNHCDVGSYGQANYKLEYSRTSRCYLCTSSTSRASNWKRDKSANESATLSCACGIEDDWIEFLEYQSTLLDSHKDSLIQCTQCSVKTYLITKNVPHKLFW